MMEISLPTGVSDLGIGYDVVSDKMELTVFGKGFGQHQWQPLSKVQIPVERPPSGQTFFIDSLTCTGDLYLVPSDHRADWQAYDIAAEESHEPGPLPEWAKPIGELSHVEFENAQEII